MNTSFSKYKPEELIGMPVRIAGRWNEDVERIIKAGKIHFQVSGSWSNSKFRIINGARVSNDTWNRVHAYLLTEDEAKEIIEDKKIKSEIYNMKKMLEGELKNLSHEQLTQIMGIIKPIA